MHAAVAADDNVILDRDMTGEHDAVARDDVVAEHTIVRDVAGGEKRVIVTHGGERSLASRGVDGKVFAEYVARADAHAGLAAGELQILRLAADTGVRKHLAGFAEPGVALDRGVVVQAGAIA